MHRIKYEENDSHAQTRGPEYDLKLVHCVFGMTLNSSVVWGMSRIRLYRLICSRDWAFRCLDEAVSYD